MRDHNCQPPGIDPALQTIYEYTEGQPRPIKMTWRCGHCATSLVQLDMTMADFGATYRQMGEFINAAYHALDVPQTWATYTCQPSRN